MISNCLIFFKWGNPQLFAYLQRLGIKINYFFPISKNPSRIMSDIIDGAFFDEEKIAIAQAELAEKKKYLKQRLPEIINIFVQGETQTMLQLTTLPDSLILSCNIPSENHIKAVLQLEISFDKQQIITKSLITCNNIFQTIKTTTLILKILTELMILNSLNRSEVITLSRQNGILTIKHIIQGNIIRQYRTNKFIQFLKSRSLVMIEIVKDIFLPLHAFANQIPKLDFEQNKESKQKMEEILKNINLSSMEIFIFQEQDMPIRIQRQGTQKIEKLRSISQHKLSQQLINLYTKQESNQKNFRKKHFLEQIDEQKLVKHLLDFKGFQKNKYQAAFYNEIIIKDERNISDKKTDIRSPISQLYYNQICYTYNQYQKVKNLKDKYFRKLVLYKQPLRKQWQIMIENEKQIVKYILKDTTSRYFPRFYFTQQKQSKLKNKLLMQINKKEINLFRLLRSYHQSLSFKTKLIFFTFLMNGVRFLHHKKVVHMDLKPMNILVGSQFLPKIIDFGNAFHKWKNNTSRCSNYKLLLTHPYSAPENLSENIPTQKADAFSIGIILFETFFDRVPFIPIKKFQSDYYRKGYSKSFFIAPQSFVYCGNYKIMLLLFRLVQKCLDSEVQTRPFSTWCAIILKILYDLIDQFHRQES